MMLVAYDAAPLLNPRTGVGHYSATLLERMLALDPEVRFRLFAVSMSRERSGIPQNDRVTLAHRRAPARLVVTTWERAGRPAGESLTGSSDVVHGTNFWVPPLRRRNAIVTVHDLTFWIYPELCTPQVQRYRWIVPRVLRRCALVLVPSATVRMQLAAELHFPAERIAVTPEGVRGTFKGAAPDEGLARRLGIPGGYVLFAGTQEPRKNLDRLLEAFARVPEPGLRLVIAGPPGWGSVDLPAVARRLGIDGRVDFCGYLSDRDLGALMAGARAFVFPSIYEGFGLPPLEAMAAGIPVVAARAGALPEVLGDAPFWCEPEDVDSIAAAILRAVSDELARAAAVEAGRAQAARYDWDVTARLTLEAYVRVMQGA